MRATLAGPHLSRKLLAELGRGADVVAAGALLALLDPVDLIAIRQVAEGVLQHLAVPVGGGALDGEPRRGIILRGEDMPMTLTIDLAREAERRLRRNGAASGKSLQEYLLQLLSELPEPPSSSEYEATLALFQEWADEDTALTPEEAAREDADWEQIEATLQANRLTLPVPEV